MLYGLQAKKFAIKATIIHQKRLQIISNLRIVKINFTNTAHSFTDRQLCNSRLL